VFFDRPCLANYQHIELVDPGQLSLGANMYLRNYMTYAYQEVPHDAKDYSPYLPLDRHIQDIYKANIAIGLKPFEAFLAASNRIEEIQDTKDTESH